MSEKQLIEKATGEKFLLCFNKKFNTDYKIVRTGDNPDIYCSDRHGNILNLEITLTQDKEEDITALLGRSNHRSLEHIKVHGMGRASSLSANVRDQLLKAIIKKINSDYGSGVALIVRDTSPIRWDWSSILGQLSQELRIYNNPFNKGIWLLTDRDEILQIL